MFLLDLSDFSIDPQKLSHSRMLFGEIKMSEWNIFINQEIFKNIKIASTLFSIFQADAHYWQDQLHQSVFVRHKRCRDQLLAGGHSLTH